MKNIERLNNGSFEVRMWRGGSLYKRRFRSLEAAKQYRALVERDYQARREGRGPVLKPPVMRLLDCLEEYLREAQERGLRQTTLEYYSTMVRPWAVFLRQEKRMDLRVDEVDQALVLRFIRWRRQAVLGRKPAGEPTIVKNLQYLLIALRAEGLEPRIRIPKTLARNGGGKRMLTPRQMQSLLAAMKVGSLERTYTEMALATGMRGCDLRALRWEQLDLNEMILAFTARKTRREQIVPLTEVAVQHLIAYRRRQRIAAATGPVFLLNGRPLGKDSLRKRLIRASRAAGIDPPVQSLGVARNFVLAALLKDKEASPLMVSRLVGHRDLRTTMDYVRQFEAGVEELRPLAERLERGEWRPDTDVN